MSVIVVGEVVLDRVRGIDGVVEEIPGGSPANVAVALRRAGVPTSLRARLSRDSAGRLLREHLHSNGIDLSAAPDVDDPALIVDVDISTDGVPDYTFHLARAADLNWTPAELDVPIAPDTRWLHTGSLAASLEPAASRIRTWATATGLPISYDVNLRPRVWTSTEDHRAAATQVDAWITQAVVVKASDEDVHALHPEITWQRWAAETSVSRLVIITLGAEGASVWRDGIEIVHVPGVRVNVIDTVGAGDTFMAWLIAGILDAVDVADPGTLHAALMNLPATTVRAISTRAAAAAAITCTRRGCDPPRRQDLA